MQPNEIPVINQMPSASPEVFAEAHDLGLRTSQGCPYAGVDLVVRKGALTALRGREGSGKTALLLTLAGRMAPSQGTLIVLGEPMPKRSRRVQRRIGLGLFAGLNDLCGNATVESIVAAELKVFGGRSGASEVEAFLEEWGLAETARMNAGDLPRERTVLLGVALGMAGDPEALVVDDVETGLTARQSMRLMGRLATIAHERGIAVIVACVDSGLAESADFIYELS